VGAALLEVGEGVRDLAERDDAVGDDFDLSFPASWARNERSSPEGCIIGEREVT
jgi:hypothetical protein